MKFAQVTNYARPVNFIFIFNYTRQHHELVNGSRMASAVTCCIYLRPITDDKSRKKRKRLHEEYSGELQEVLNKLILETFPSLLGCDLFSFKETSQRDSYICGECRNKLSQVSRLQEQLQKIKNHICQKLSSLYILECGHKCHNTQQQTPCNCDA